MLKHRKFYHENKSKGRFAHQSHLTFNKLLFLKKLFPLYQSNAYVLREGEKERDKSTLMSQM